LTQRAYTNKNAMISFDGNLLPHPGIVLHTASNKVSNGERASFSYQVPFLAVL